MLVIGKYQQVAQEEGRLGDRLVGCPCRGSRRKRGARIRRDDFVCFGDDG